MTRINVIEPHLLVDNHLLAEHRECTRIPNTILSGKAVLDLDKIHPHYVLGRGHVTFFYNKLQWLYERYNALHNECIKRGFNVTYKWPMELVEVRPELFGTFIVRDVDIEINVERVLQRFPKAARMCGVKIELNEYKRKLL